SLTNFPSKDKELASGGFRYGFNGMEKDDEVKGSGNHVDFGARGYDPRLGRWLSIDPKFRKYPFVSGYAFVVNSPIRFIDFNGEDFYDPTKSIQEKYQHTNTFLKNVKDYYNGSGDEKFAAIFDANFKAAFEK